MTGSQWKGGEAAAAEAILSDAEPGNSPNLTSSETVEEVIIDVKRAVICALLARLAEQGLISNSTNQKALDLVHLRVDFPRFFRYPLCSTEEA